MGGAQMYVRNKVDFETQKGYSVYVFSCVKKKVVIYDLKKYSDFVFCELKLSPGSYTKKQRKRIVDKILNKINYQLDDVVFVESNDIVMSLWGEIIAQITKGKHLVYLLNENFSKNEKYYKQFFSFKLKRREIAGIHKTSLLKLFGGDNHILEEQLYWLPAMCMNVVDHCDNPVLKELDDDSIKICSIGRLNKPYVIEMCKELRQFALLYKSKNIQVILLGDSPNIIDKIKIKNILNLSNIKILITGYIFPIPKKLFPKIDVFASCSGSAIVSYGEKRPTILIDPQKAKVVGIPGYDIKHILDATETIGLYPLSAALQKVLDDKVKIEYEDLKPLESVEHFLQIHDNFVANSTIKKQYFDVLRQKNSKQEDIFKFFNVIFGKTITSCFLYPIFKKIYHTLISK